MTTKTITLLSATAVAALLAAPSGAQMFGTDYGYDTFETGFGETGTYDALDTDDDAYLDRGEFATGLYADYDRDDDLLNSEEEFDLGTDRYLGADYDTDFATYDVDGDGFLDQEEFGEFYGTDYTDYYDTYDTYFADIDLPTERGAVSGPTGALLHEASARDIDAFGLVVVQEQPGDERRTGVQRGREHAHAGRTGRLAVDSTIVNELDRIAAHRFVVDQQRHPDLDGMLRYHLSSKR